MDLEKFSRCLLDEGFLLTALELHAETSERGKSVDRLKDFFEDSANFERFTRKSVGDGGIVPPSPCPSRNSSVEGIAALNRTRAGSQVIDQAVIICHSNQ